MRFSDLLGEAIRSGAPELSEEQAGALRTELSSFLRAWIEIHEPDDAGVDPQDPQRLLLLQLLEELDDESEIPVVE
jgi:hypothetical protein